MGWNDTGGVGNRQEFSATGDKTMNNIRSMAFLLICIVTFGMLNASDKVKVGADVLLERRFDLIEGKRIGLVTNHSALLADGRHLADALRENKKTRLVALFGPEHGIRGDAPDGRSVQHGRDSKTGLPVYSLYGKTTKPTDDMLKDIDILIFDIQDVGVRFYTFESTLSLAMEAAAEHGMPYIVLDRPNPIRGTWLEGYVRLDSLSSFVGLHPTPMAHGMTIGELATMFNEEGWLKNGIKANLKVIQMEGWSRSKWFDESGLAWIKPSPNMSTLKTAVVYPGTCLIEGTNLSEGRGTEKPFEYLGAPFVDGTTWAGELNAQKLPGIVFKPVTFTPQDIPNVAMNPKYRGTACEGIVIDVVERDIYEPVRTAVYILSTAKKLFAKDFQWRVASIDRLAGTPVLRRSIDAGEPPQKIAEGWTKEVERFSKMRKKYLLYR
jgi:uncharacterized protein YbbC (DUF1343 family)